MILRCFDSFSARTHKASSTLGAIALFAIGSPLYAEEPAAVKELAPFRGVAGLSLRSSTTNSSDATYQILLSPGINLEYEMKNLVTFGLSVKANKDLNNEERSTLTDLTMSASHSIKFTEAFGLGLDLSYGAPVSKDLYKYSNSKGTLGASGTLRYAFEGILTGLALSGGVTYERYLYEYQFANGGAILTKYSFSQSYGISYTWKRITGAANFTDVSSWDFDGSQENDSFLAVETIKYDIDGIWSVNVGHTNDGATFDYLGARNNVQLYDKRRSQVFIGASYSF